MQKDSITIRLRLPGLEVLRVQERQECIEVVAGYSNQEAVCPRCGRSTWQVHQWHRQRKRDAKVWGKTVWLLLWKRRFRCRICRKVFTEPDPTCGRRRRTTRRLRQEVAKQAKDASVRAVARWQEVSEGLVERSWQEVYRPPARGGAPRYLGMDGFCVGRPRKMWTGLWDLEAKAPLGAVAGEGQGDVRPVLEALPRPEVVRAVAIDLSEPYRQALQLVLPEAVVVADKFHVVALANRALREVRKGRRQRGNLAWLVDRGVERLSAVQQQELAKALADQPEVARAWALKERLRGLYRCRSRQQAAVELDTWVDDARLSGLAPFGRLAGTLTRWQKEVLNYWRFPITNALVEGKHNRLKTLKRRAYGYRNDRSLLLRFLNLVHTN